MDNSMIMVSLKSKKKMLTIDRQLKNTHFQLFLLSSTIYPQSQLKCPTFQPF